jgi:uncharacterized membrane protein YfcA
MLDFFIYFAIGSVSSILCAIDQIATASRRTLPASVFSFLIYLFGAIILTDLVNCSIWLKITYAAGGAFGAYIGIKSFNKLIEFFKIPH